MSENLGGDRNKVEFFILNKHFGDIQRLLDNLIIASKYHNGFKKDNKSIIVITNRAAEGLVRLYKTVNHVIVLPSDKLYDLGIYAKSALCQHSNLFRDEAGMNGDMIGVQYEDTVYKIPSHRYHWGVAFPLKDENEIKKTGRYISQKTSEAILEICESQDIKPQNLLILCPYARSSSMLPNAIWEKFANTQESQGYHVYTNVTENEKEINGTRRLTVPFDVLVALGEEGAVIVGVQSGAMDIVHRMDCGIYNINIHVLLNPYDFKCVRDRRVNIPLDRKVNTYHYSVYETDFDQVSDKLGEIVSIIRNERVV